MALLQRYLIKLYLFNPVLGFLLPFLAKAQSPNPAYPSALFGVLVSTFRLIIGFLFVLATVIFLYGMVKYIASSADDASRKKSQGLMVWGIIGLAVMTVAWGITSILVTYFGVPTTPPNFVPFPPAG